MNRLEEVRKIIDPMLLEMTDAEERRCAYIHIYGVSQLAAMLALRRDLDPEIAAVSGMCHDIYAYCTGIIPLHDQNSAEMIRPIIRDMGLFSNDEQVTIISAVFHHSDKASFHQPYDELLKDADLLQRYLYNTGLPVNKRKTIRLESVLAEFGLPCNYEVTKCAPSIQPVGALEDRRARLADIAEELASEGIVGLPDDPRFCTICRYWPGKDVIIRLNGYWCAAFVYHCCMEAGFVLPMRHPLVSCRFPAVKAWLDWARLPETEFFHYAKDETFTPGRGDLVVYDGLLSDGPHDHIGIVLSVDGDTMLVAEGNGDANKSIVVKRSHKEKVSGFIRIDNNWRYQLEGRVYDPQRLIEK